MLQQSINKIKLCGFLAAFFLVNIANAQNQQETNRTLDSIRYLSVAENKQLENSSEGGNWRVFAVQAPICDTQAQQKTKGKLSKKQKEQANEKRKACIAANKSCISAQKIAKKYNVQAVCSPVYSEISILTTQAQVFAD